MCWSAGTGMCRRLHRSRMAPTRCSSGPCTHSVSRLATGRTLSPPAASKQYRRIQTWAQQSRVHGVALANRWSLRLAPASGSISSCPQLSWAPGGLHAITSLLCSRLFVTWGEGTMKARSMASKLSPLVSQPGVSLFDHLPSSCTVLCCTVL